MWSLKIPPEAACPGEPLEEPSVLHLIVPEQGDTTQDVGKREAE